MTERTPFITCWFALAALLVGHARARRTWVTGQAAFAAPWLLSLTALVAFPDAQGFVSWTGAAFVIGVHLSFFFGSLAASPRITTAAVSAAPAVDPDERAIMLRIGYVSTIAGIIGAVATARATGAWESFQGGTLVLTRSLLLNRDVAAPTAARLLSNLLYPAAIAVPVIFVASRRRPVDWIAVFLPVAGAMLYGFAYGGRGAAFIVTPMVLCTLAVGARGTMRIRRSELMTVMLLIVAAGTFSTVITDTRGESPFAEGMAWYLAGPVPALSDWLATHNLDAFGFDFTQLALVREVMNAFGASIVRAVDIDVVYVPDIFNVFTHVVEHVKAFGVVGTLVAPGLLGILSARMERRPLTLARLGTRATFYAYLAYSIFLDLSFFIVGLWLAAAVMLSVAPLAKWRRRIRELRTVDPTAAARPHFEPN